MLRAAGCDVDGPLGAHVYIDKPTQHQMKSGTKALVDRAHCIRDLRSRPPDEPVDEIVVCAIWVLALSSADLFEIAAQLAPKGAVIHDLATGKKMHWVPEMADLAEAAAQVKRFQDRRKIERALVARAASDKKPGPKAKLSGRLLELFLEDWGNPKAGSNEQVAERHRISTTTAHRLAGMSRTEAIRRADRVRHEKGL